MKNTAWKEFIPETPNCRMSSLIIGMEQLETLFQIPLILF